MSVEAIRSTWFARNPRVARTVLEFGFGRELGEGVDRMFGPGLPGVPGNRGPGNRGPAGRGGYLTPIGYM